MTTTTKLLAAAFLLAATATLATASDHGRGGEREEDEEHEHEGRRARGEGEGTGSGRLAPGTTVARPAAASGGEALYRKECGSCHLAFPPGLLPAESHRRTLAGLEKHFGQNAELDAETSAKLETYLVANAAGAGTHRKSGKILASLDGAAPLRVTEVPYFQRKHRKIGPDVVARPAVKSLANCGACHSGARSWDFDDDGVKIPR
jgi:hypothetical protein